MEVLHIYFLVYTLLAVRFIYGSKLLIERNILINKTYKDAYLDFCKQSCIQRDLIPSPHCGKCYCDGTCYLYNDCCLDTRIMNNYPEDMIDISCTATTFPLLKKKTGINTEPCDPNIRDCPAYLYEEHAEAYKLITSCPKSFSGSQEVVTRCENIDMEEQSTIHPVTDMNTQLSYRNVDCAKCNEANNIKKWEMWVICRGEIPVQFGNSVKELFHIFRTTEGCSIHFNPEELENQRACDLDKTPIDSCNVTGLWKGDGPDLPSKCRENYPFENTVFDYSNVFCYLCNTQDLIYPEETTRIEDIAGVVNDELTDLQPVNYSVVDIYQNVCRPVLCPDGRQLVNGTCKSLFRRFNGYIYTICLKYKITVEKSKVSHLQTDKFTTNYVRIISQIVKTNGMVILGGSETILSMTPCVNGYLNATLAMSLRLRPSKSLESEDVNIRHIQDKIKMTVGSDDTAPYETLSVEQISDCVKRVMSEQGSEVSCLSHKIVRPQRVTENTQTLSYNSLAKLVYVSNLLMCPQIVLERLEVDHDSDKGMITILANNKTLTSTKFQLEDAGYLICVEDYIENAKIVQNEGCTARSVTEYAESTSRVAGLGGSIFSCLLLYVMFFFTF